MKLCVYLCSPGKGGDQEGGGKAEKSLTDFAAEYAKSNRSTCKGCEQKIEKVKSFSLVLHLACSPTGLSSNRSFCSCILYMLHLEGSCRAAFLCLRNSCVLEGWHKGMPQALEPGLQICWCFLLHERYSRLKCCLPAYLVRIKEWESHH